MTVAVIGCGYWGRNLVRNFQQLGALALVCDATTAGRATAAQLAPATPIVADVQEVWQADVPAVVIATPAETHFDLVRQALLAGKDVDEALQSAQAVLASSAATSDPFYWAGFTVVRGPE